MNSSPRLGIREIVTRAGLTPGSLDADSITWCLSPWLNASGRLEHAIASYKLLTTTNPSEARELAGLLGQQNIERQRLTAKAMTEARAQIADPGTGPFDHALQQGIPPGYRRAGGRQTLRRILPSGGDRQYR